MKNIFFAAVASLVLFSSCREIFAKRVRGNGNIVTQNRDLGDFNSVHVSGNIDVYASQDSSFSVKVETDENLQQYIEVINDDGVLRIQEKEGYNPRSGKTIKVYVSSGTFKNFEASGSCDMYSQDQINSTGPIEFHASGSCKITMDINAPKITAKLSGACDVILKGETKELSVDGSGSTDIRCFEMKADIVTVDLSGSGDAEVYAETTLKGSASGSADIKYKGNARPDISSSGAVSIKKAD
jgi:hypothetical protein